MPYGTITSNIASLLGFLDSVVYQLVSLVLTGLYNIAGTKIFTNGSLTEFTDRIYVILGIFMLFKLAFSILTSIVNPDKFNDKQSGMSKIIIRVVITLSLLLMVPTIFQFAYQVQGNVLKALPQVILGPNAAQDSETVGNDIALTVMGAFVNKNECEVDFPNDDDKFENIWDYADIVSQQCDHSHDNKKIFKYRYTFVVSTFVGIIMIVLLVLTSVDVAMRLIKLSILQIIAPIPIMTYIDPKSEKDGAFGNWMKECIQTYISLFIQMGVIYVIIFLISSIINDVFKGMATGEQVLIEFPANIGTVGQLWVFIFIVIGAFLFMRQAPKYIMKVLGIKEGTGLGIGLNAGLAGLGAALSGAGLLGTAAALNQSLNDGINANAEGKSAFSTGGLQKGRDLAAQFRSGDNKAKAKSTTEKINDAIMGRKAAKLGFTAKTVDDAKAAKFAASDAAANASSMRDRFLQKGLAGLSVSEQGMVRDLLGLKTDHKITSADMDNYVNKRNTNANKASSYYDDAKSYARILGVKTDDDLADKFSSKYKAREHKGNNKAAASAIERGRELRTANNDTKFETYRTFDPNRWKPELNNTDDTLDPSSSFIPIEPDDTLQMMADAQNNDNNRNNS